MRALLLAALLMASPAAATEWWHGEFVYDGSSTCENDSYSSFSDATVERWEGSCDIKQKTPMKGVDAVHLQMSCTYEESETIETSELLVKLSDSQMVSYPGNSTLTRCSAIQPAKQCPFNARLYRAIPHDAQGGDDYQDLQLADGFTSGTAIITEYRDGKAVWEATGEHACSNGAVICSLMFPTMSGEPADAPYEVMLDADGEYGTIVAPAFSQNVYLSDRYAEMNGKNYGGLVADLFGGFAPAEDEVLTPHNVYEYVGCRQP